MKPYIDRILAFILNQGANTLSCGDAVAAALSNGDDVVFTLYEPNQIEQVLSGRTYVIKYDSTSDIWESRGYHVSSGKVRDVPYGDYGPPNGSVVVLSNIFYFGSDGTVGEGIDRHGNDIEDHLKKYIRGKVGLAADPMHVCVSK